MRSIVNHRLIQPAVRLMKQGATPEMAAWSLGLGTGFSLCPLPGVPTLLCTVVPLKFRLNLPLMQAVNYLGTVPRLMLIIPYIRAGEFLCGADPISLSITRIQASLRDDFWGSMYFLGEAMWHASVSWMVSLPLLSFVLYLALLPWLRRLAAVRRIRLRPKG